MEESNEDYNKIFKSVPEIETKIKDLNKELKNRNDTHRIIGTIHNMRWDLDNLKNEGKTDFRTQSIINSENKDIIRSD